MPPPNTMIATAPIICVPLSFMPVPRSGLNVYSGMGSAVARLLHSSSEMRSFFAFTSLATCSL